MEKVTGTYGLGRNPHMKVGFVLIMSRNRVVERKNYGNLENESLRKPYAKLLSQVKSTKESLM